MRNVQLVQGLAVVGASGRLSAVGALPERHLVDVELEYLVLLKLRFDLQRQQHLLELAQETPFQAERDVARQLHGDGARAGAQGAFEQQALDQAEGVVGQGYEIDAAVLVEALVLGVEQRADEVARHLVEGDRDAAAFAKLGDERLIRSEHPQRSFQFDVPIGLRIGYLRVQIEKDGGQCKR